MNIRKISVIMLLMLALTVQVQAEQPAAEEYRQMFQSGNYYLEYSIRDYDLVKRYSGRSMSGKKIKPGVDDADEEMGLYRGYGGGASSVGSFGGMFQSMQPIGSGVTYAVANVGNDRIQNFKKIVKKSGLTFLWGIEIGGSQKANVIPRLMYKNGKYYRFAAGFGMASTDSKNDQALMLSEEDLQSSELNPEEGWSTIRIELALPLEFSIFNHKDSFLDGVSMVEMPVYQESTERSIGKKTYECDKYVSKEKTGENDKARDYAYYALYKEGKLALIQKYRIPPEGEEEIVEEIFVRDMAAQLPESIFEFSNEIPVFAAGMGDVNDFLGIPVQVGTLGGKSNVK